MQPDFGSDLRALLFEQDTEDFIDRIQLAIEEAISTWLPYINIEEANVITDESNPNRVKIDIDFSLNYEPDRFDSVNLNFDASSDITSGAY